MRIPKYLSPSSLSKFEENTELFYEQYLSEIRNPRPPQQSYMAVGSAFDAFVKSRIHTDVHGEEATKGTPFEFTTIFESQVEAHIRDEVLERSTDLFQQYIDCGAYAELLADILKSPYAPEMEFTVRGDIEGVPLLGKPDLRYITAAGVHVICDWKVNGSTSKIGASPTQGYQRVRDAYGSRTHNKAHKKYRGEEFGDVEVNDLHLEQFCDYWADQLAIYSWLLGERVGSEDFVVRMEQIACRPVQSRDLPRAKCATHMARIGRQHQREVMDRLHLCWNTIQSGHIFKDLTREESDSLCRILDAKAATPKQLRPNLRKYSEEAQRRF